MTRCPESITLGAAEVRCHLDEGHQGQHRNESGTTRITWDPGLRARVRQGGPFASRGAG
jgi:hypothetical protein